METSWFQYDDIATFGYELNTSVRDGSGIYSKLRASSWFWVWLRYKRVTNPQEWTSMEGEVTTPGSTLPLLGVPVTLLRNGVVLGRAVTRPPFGQYILPSVPVTDSLVLSVTLENAATFVPSFRVIYGQGASPLAYVITLPFAASAAPNPMRRDISFSDNPGVITGAGINRAHLDDLARIYYHTHEAWQLADSVSQRLDFQLPVDIVAFSTINNGVYWSPLDPTGVRLDPYINLGAAGGASAIGDDGRPDNREWHEFGHHVLADMFGDQMPEDPLGCPSPPRPGFDCNHWGYMNASTTDSWAEGFAEFYSLVVAHNVAAEPRPESYRWAGWEDNLETNYLAWGLHYEDDDPDHLLFHPPPSPDEELAVAGILWDLIDPIDAADATIMAGTTYADCVAEVEP